MQDYMYVIAIIHPDIDVYHGDHSRQSSCAHTITHSRLAVIDSCTFVAMAKTGEISDSICLSS